MQEVKEILYANLKLQEMKTPRFNQIDRVVIRHWNGNLPKSSFMRWWQKPMIVALYENAKAQRDFNKEIKNLLNNRKLNFAGSK